MIGMTEAIVANSEYHFCNRVLGEPIFGPDGTTTINGWPGSFRFLCATIGSHGFFRTGPSNSWLMFNGLPNTILSTKFGNLAFNVCRISTYAAR